MIYERGTPDEYEVIWGNGHVDRITAHQVSWAGGPPLLGIGPATPRRVLFHAEVDGHWRLLLVAMEDDITTIRNVTQVGL